MRTICMDGLWVSIYPQADFKWLSKKEINKTDLAKSDKDDSKKELVIEEDLEYPPPWPT